MKLTYAQEFFDYLKAQNLREFTHRDILLVTGTNCSYSVLVDLKEMLYKLGLILKETKEERTNQRNQKRIFKKYTIEEV